MYRFGSRDESKCRTPAVRNFFFDDYIQRSWDYNTAGIYIVITREAAVNVGDARPKSTDGSVTLFLRCSESGLCDAV